MYEACEENSLHFHHHRPVGSTHLRYTSSNRLRSAPSLSDTLPARAAAAAEAAAAPPEAEGAEASAAEGEGSDILAISET